MSPKTTTPHASPRTRVAMTLATAAGAAAVAATALAPSASAQARNDSVWDRVAMCESTQQWDINTGNGFYGGLQFTDSTWDAYGGDTYAGRADYATRAEQIEVARRVLESQGPNAWPVCGPRAGLTKDNGHATSAPVPTSAAGTGKKAPSTPSTGHQPKHGSAKTADRHDHRGKHRATGGYVVKSGDTLSGIAGSHHVDGGWQALYRANRSQVSDPDVVHVGQHLSLP